MRRTRARRATAAVAAALLLSATVAGCGDDASEAEAEAGAAAPPSTTSSATTPPSPPTASADGAGAEGGLSSEALRGRVGQTVTVTGEVAALVGSNAFTLGGDTIGENPVLVVSASGATVQEGDQVRVRGKVIRFSVPGVEQDLDLDLVDNEFAEFDGEPALQASTVRPAASAGPGEGGQGGASQEALEDRIGQQFTLRGEVAEVLGRNAFTIGGDSIGENPVLVVSATKRNVQEGDTVRITGTVIRFSCRESRRTSTSTWSTTSSPSSTATPPCAPPR